MATCMNQWQEAAMLSGGTEAVRLSSYLFFNLIWLYMDINPFNFPTTSVMKY